MPEVDVENDPAVVAATVEKLQAEASYLAAKARREAAAAEQAEVGAAVGRMNLEAETVAHEAWRASNERNRVYQFSGAVNAQSA